MRKWHFTVNLLDREPSQVHYIRDGALPLCLAVAGFAPSPQTYLND